MILELKHNKEKINGINDSDRIYYVSGTVLFGGIDMVGLGHSIFLSQNRGIPNNRPAVIIIVPIKTIKKVIITAKIKAFIFY